MISPEMRTKSTTKSERVFMVADLKVEASCSIRSSVWAQKRSPKSSASGYSRSNVMQIDKKRPCDLSSNAVDELCQALASDAQSQTSTRSLAMSHLCGPLNGNNEEQMKADVRM